MNWAVLKDSRTMAGLIVSILLNIGAIVLAANNISYWIVLVVVALIVLFFSVAKADKVTKKE